MSGYCSSEYEFVVRYKNPKVCKIYRKYAVGSELVSVVRLSDDGGEYYARPRMDEKTERLAVEAIWNELESQGLLEV